MDTHCTLLELHADCKKSYRGLLIFASGHVLRAKNFDRNGFLTVFIYMDYRRLKGRMSKFVFPNRLRSLNAVMMSQHETYNNVKLLKRND